MNDPIVAEVRAIRDELAAQCDYDLQQIFRQLRQQQASSGRKYVRYPPRRIVTTEDRHASGQDEENGRTTRPTDDTNRV